MPEKFEGGIPPQEQKSDEEIHRSKKELYEISNKYMEQLQEYADDEQVVASMGTIGTSVLLEASKLRQLIHDNSIDAMNSVGMGNNPEEARAKLWNGNLIILSPEKSREFLSGIQQLLETKPELEKFLKESGEEE